MSWPPTRVAQLLEGAPSRYERCPADPAFAVDQLELLVDSECQHVLFAAMRQDWGRANVDAYDAARKSIEMLLLAHGWRVRNAPGAHRWRVRTELSLDAQDDLVPTDASVAAWRESL